MNLKKVKESPKGVERLYKELDSVMLSSKVCDANTPEEHAEQIERFIDNFPSLLQHSGSERFIKAVDEVVSAQTLAKIANELSVHLDIPESLDNTLWDYIQHTCVERLEDAALVIANSEELSFEDKLIIVDTILSNEQ